MRQLLAACVAISLVSSPLGAQQQQPPPPTFRSSVTLVTVDVIVLDHDGKPVPGLTADDFQIKLNGKVQPVRALSYVSVAQEAAPLTVTELPPDEPVTRHVVTNSTPPADARLFVLLVDDLSFAPGAGKGLFSAAARFVARQPKSDYAGVTTTSNTVTLNPTQDRAAVSRALNSITGEFVDPRRPSQVTGATVSIEEALDIVDFSDQATLRRVITRECFGGNGNDIAAIRTDLLVARNQCAGSAESAARQITAATHAATGRQLAAIVATINAMKAAKGLKQLVLLSQGIGVARNGLSDFEPVARAAAEAGVQLSILVDEGDDLDMGDGGRSVEGANGDASTPPDAGLTARRRDDQRMFRSAMQTLADASGGFFQNVIGQGDKAFERAAVAGSALYRLGVEPPSDAPEGRAFSVATAVNRSGVTVQANRTAVIPGPPPDVSADKKMTEAIKEGQPFFNVPIRLSAARHKASGNQVELVIGVEVPASVPGPLTMQFGLVSEKGELKTGKTPMKAPDGGGPYRFTFPMQVAPGKYSLRFAVTDAAGSVGSVDTPIDARLNTVGAMVASDVLTWWNDAQGQSQFLALDELPHAVNILGAALELTPATGTVFPPGLAVRFALVPSGKTAPLLQQEAELKLAGDRLRAEAQLTVSTVPPGTYTLRATVWTGQTLAGTTAVVIRRQ